MARATAPPLVLSSAVSRVSERLSGVRRSVGLCDDLTGAVRWGTLEDQAGSSALTVGASWGQCGPQQEWTPAPGGDSGTVTELGRAWEGASGADAGAALTLRFPGPGRGGSAMRPLSVMPLIL